MGQKVYPIGFRLGITEEWRSRWYQDKGYSQTLAEDLALREYLKAKLRRAAISRIDIERKGDKVFVEIWTARPGIVIGKKGAEVDALRKDLEQLVGHPVAVNIVEVKRPELDATLVAQSVAEQLVARVSFRRAMKKCVTSAMKLRRQGDPRHQLRQARERRDGQDGMVPRGKGSPPHPAGRHRLRVCRGSHHVWAYRGQGARV